MKKQKEKTPFIGKKILRTLLPEGEREGLLGDFDEMFRELATDKNKVIAWLWYLLQIVILLPSYCKEKIQWGGIMLKNYMKITVRNIKRYKTYSIINITGLAIGMATCILILFWVRDELTFERFHEKRDNIYRVLQSIRFSEVVTWAITQGPLAPALKEEIPEIEDAVRVVQTEWSIRYNNNTFVREGYHVDPSFLKMFTFPLVRGTPETVLSEPYSIVLTEEMAETLFGNEEPVGKTVRVNERGDCIVTGVIENVPGNSHLQFDFLTTMELAREIGYTVDIWPNSRFYTYVLLPKNISPEDVEQKIYNFLDEKPTLEEWEKLTLQPLTELHFANGIGFDIAGTGSYQLVKIFFLTALFILIIACANFTNLSTARSVLRAKEVGMRKVTGAQKKQLISQFLSESVLITFISFLFAIVLASAMFPLFNSLSGKTFSWHLFFEPDIMSGLAAIVLLTGLISGSYPAFVFSSYRPVNLFKSSGASGNKSQYLRKILVVFQFSISIILIFGTLVLYKQIRYMKNKDLGYNKENLVYLPVNEEILHTYEAFKNELSTNSHILGVTGTESLPTYGISFTNGKWRWDGKNPEEDIVFCVIIVDYNYCKTFNIKILEGREFSRKFPGDTLAVILNESALKATGLHDPVGKALRYEDYPNEFKIIGIAQDYHFRSLHSKIEPLLMLYSPTTPGNPDRSQYICLRLHPENVRETLGYIEKKWKEYAPGTAFSYGFLDENLDNLYQADNRIGNIVKVFAFLAVFVSCLGLFGLASFVILTRRKEIGIRKILGSSVVSIAVLLTKEFSKWVLLANIIALPAGYFVMNSLLKSYPYRIKIGPELFILSGLFALFTALITVSYQAVKSAYTNPVKSLRYE